MIDIVSNEPGQDMGLFDTSVERAKNILSVQVGALSYQQDFGIDIAYFLSEDFKFQTASFESYCVQRLANYSINVTEVIESDSALFQNLIFNIGSDAASGSLIVR